MKKIKASEAMINVLLDWGVKRVYGLPGDSIDTTIDALHRHDEEIDFIQVRHEEVASLAATSEAKLTGTVGVCLSIGGPVQFIYSMAYMTPRWITYLSLH